MGQEMALPHWYQSGIVHTILRRRGLGPDLRATHRLSLAWGERLGLGGPHHHRAPVDGEEVVVGPRDGRLVLFLSGSVDHQVEPLRRQKAERSGSDAFARAGLTCWFQ